jgi:RNA polymerase sigma-70 factor, ECF subfamily
MESSAAAGRLPAGDERAFERLVEPHRGELHAHCYRMLGSVHEADDALQETLLRAWRGLARFEGRSSLRSWLYTIATNTCLTHLRGRSRRALPLDVTAAAQPHTPPGEPLVESVWVEPYPDAALEVPEGYASPDASYERREAIELAFVAALQTLPPNQRAALILREVLGYSAKEAADVLDTSVASVNSALQRARAAVGERVPERSQQQTLRALGDDGLRAIVERYVDAWERRDVDAFIAMLTDDASFSMPPLATWYRGRESIATWAATSPMNGEWLWRAQLTSANGQPALGFYAWDEREQAHMPFALNVLTLHGSQVSDVVAFIARSAEPVEPERFERYPEEPPDADRVDRFFAAFGLPDRLPA